MTLLIGEERPKADVAAGPTAAALGAVQFEVGEGPCFDRIERTDVVWVGDLALDRRWPAFAAAAVRRGVRGLLAARSEVAGFGRAVLTLYSPEPDAFTDADRDVVGVLGALLSIAVEGREHRRRADNLAVALESSRQIGVAKGILMARELVTADQAFELLRAASQRKHRKLREVAEEVARTGELSD